MKKEIKKIIEERLKFNKKESNLFSMFRNTEIGWDSMMKEHHRFNMSGYGYTPTSDTQEILSKFEDLGIYDYTHYLFLDFYKGSVTLYMKYWNSEEDLNIELHGYGTKDIIYEILIRTVYSNKRKRRRD